MKKTTDTKEKGVTIRLIIIVLLIDLGLISAWVYGVIKTENSQILGKLFRNFIDILGNISTFSGVIFGINIIRKNSFNKGGTIYYPELIGEDKLTKIISVFDHREDFENAEKIVNEKNKIGGFDSEYFNEVYKLQEKDENFIKVWNDYNFLAAKEIKNKKERGYFEKLKRYVYFKVSDNIQKNT
ncbi:hypothetical protein [Treponema pedis]|uniref:hypothetical protein n=1 Tax=Treponema pedis TaxID=409322 RepID=UPI00042634EE|nr:hypothetical protein [Treponema pedis]